MYDFVVDNLISSILRVRTHGGKESDLPVLLVRPIDNGHTSDKMLYGQCPACPGIALLAGEIAQRCERSQVFLMRHASFVVTPIWHPAGECVAFIERAQSCFFEQPQFQSLFGNNFFQLARFKAQVFVRFL